MMSRMQCQLTTWPGAPGAPQGAPFPEAPAGPPKPPPPDSGAATDRAPASASHLTEANALLPEMVAETEAFARAAGGAIGDVAVNWLTTQYLLAVRAELAATPAGPERFKLLRLTVRDAAVLQRGGHSAARLQLARERLQFEQQKHRDTLAAAQPEIPKRRDPKLPLSDADRQAIIDKADEILGLK